MASYVNSRKLFVMLVCLQSSAFFAGAYTVLVSRPDPSTGMVTIDFKPDNGGGVSVEADPNAVFSSYGYRKEKYLPSFRDSSFCFGVARGTSDVDHAEGYLMAYELCAVSTTDCSGVSPSDIPQTDTVTCTFDLTDCDQGLNRLLHCK